MCVMKRWLMDFTDCVCFFSRDFSVRVKRTLIAGVTLSNKYVNH